MIYQLSKRAIVLYQFILFERKPQFLWLGQNLIIVMFYLKFIGIPDKVINMQRGDKLFSANNGKR